MLANSKPATSVALTINWKITLLGLCFLPLLLRLGFWQIERADEKRQLIAHAEEQLQLPPLSLQENNIQPDQLKQRRVIASGKFLAGKYWLLDNRVFRGKVGYEVIAPLETDVGQIVLINRGWVPAPPTRQQLPDVSFPLSKVIIQGRWKLIEKNSLSRDLENLTAIEDSWPIRVQSVDLFEMKRIIGKDIFWGYLQIDPENSVALQVAWKNINVMPEKHLGYAVQWFAMAVALIIALIFANTNLSVALKHVWEKKKHDNNKGEINER